MLRVARRCASSSSSSAADGGGLVPDTFATVVKAAAGAWLSYKLLTTLAGGDTLLIQPNLTLLRSAEPANRDAGIGRIHWWHRSPAALGEVVTHGGAEALVASLDLGACSADATLQSVELLGCLLTY